MRYGVRRVCAAWELPRSTWYARRRGTRPDRPALAKRGPKTMLSDAQLTDAIGDVLAASPFLGEGHRKVWARLRHADIRTGKPRVLRLMRERGMLAPQRAGSARGPRAHDGVIVTEAPDLTWGTDLTMTLTVCEGQAAVFVAVDHCTCELVGVHAAGRATRWEALEPIKQGVREFFGSVRQNVAHGLQLRHDNGTQYLANTGSSYTGTLNATERTVVASQGLHFVPVSPCRIADTRNAPGVYGQPALVGGTPRNFPITGRCGVPSNAIAASLNISEDTVQTHVKSIFVKLGVHDRTEAVVAAVRLGIVHLD